MEAREMGKVEDRRHARYELEEPGFLRVIDQPDESIHMGAFVVTILDISKRGLRIRCSRPLPHGTPVEVRCRGQRIIGEVRYARGMEETEVHMGVRADSVDGLGEDVDLTLLFPDLIPR
jgi:PilZ domain